MLAMILDRGSGLPRARLWELDPSVDQVLLEAIDPVILLEEVALGVRQELPRCTD